MTRRIPTAPWKNHHISWQCRANSAQQCNQNSGNMVSWHAAEVMHIGSDEWGNKWCIFYPQKHFHLWPAIAWLFWGRGNCWFTLCVCWRMCNTLSTAASPLVKVEMECICQRRQIMGRRKNIFLLTRGSMLHLLMCHHHEQLRTWNNQHSPGLVSCVCASWEGKLALFRQGIGIQLYNYNYVAGSSR